MIFNQPLSPELVRRYVEIKYSAKADHTIGWSLIWLGHGVLLRSVVDAAVLRCVERWGRRWTGVPGFKRSAGREFQRAQRVRCEIRGRRAGAVGAQRSGERTGQGQRPAKTCSRRSRWETPQTRQGESLRTVWPPLGGRTRRRCEHVTALACLRVRRPRARTASV